MIGHRGFRYLFISFMLCFANSVYFAQTAPRINEGEICRKGDGNSSDYICRQIVDCKVALQGLKKNVLPELCSPGKPMVCCPPLINTTANTQKLKSLDPPMETYSATEKCREYSELIYTYQNNPILSLKNNGPIKIKDCLDVKTLIVGGAKAAIKEFPHMALLGYHEKVERNRWGCGGSLISNKWILTAAHCEKIDASNYAQWARLGDLNFLTDTDNARPRDYRIVKRVIHPNYQVPSSYNDIALFLLEKDVEFSSYIRPICLNTVRSLNVSTAEATGWGQIKYKGHFSADLLKVQLNIFPPSQCNTTYSSNIQQLPSGIVDDSMICAGNLEGGKDTCGGDSGGPFQIKNNNYQCMYTQIGVTSFGQFCAKKNTPAIYTRVSEFVPWIEKIVWPKN